MTGASPIGVNFRVEGTRAPLLDTSPLFYVKLTRMGQALSLLYTVYAVFASIVVTGLAPVMPKMPLCSISSCTIRVKRKTCLHDAMKGLTNWLRQYM